MQDLTEPGQQQEPSVERSPEEQAALAASNGERLDEEQIQRATDWFLSEEDEPVAITTFDVNVAPASKPAKWIRWSIRPLTRHEFKQIQEDASGDDLEANVRTVIAGSIEPNFADERVRHGLADPADILKRKVKHKPGLIEQLSRKINEASGFGLAGAASIRSVDAVGNS